MSLSPPAWLAPSSRAPLPMGRRKNRAVLAQCQTCLVSGTALVDAGTTRSMNLPADYYRGQWSHAGCGGRFSFFDIEDR